MAWAPKFLEFGIVFLFLMSIRIFAFNFNNFFTSIIKMTVFMSYLTLEGDFFIVELLYMHPVVHF